MSITNRLGSFALIGIKDLMVYERGTKDVVAKISHLVGINISDELATDHMRGGYGNPKLLTIYGDRDTTMTATSASMSPELLKVLTGATLERKVKLLDEVEELVVKSGKTTLTQEPATQEMSVEVIDIFGKVVRKLTQGASATADTYTLDGVTITVDSSVEKIRVVYEVEREVETLEMKDITPKNYTMAGLAVAKEIETGKLYKAWVEIPNASVKPSYSISAKNEASAPDSLELTIDCLASGVDYPIAISFMEE